MKFQENHPSFKYLMLAKRETPVVPLIIYYDSPDTKLFCWTCIDNNDAIELLNENDPVLNHMEHYAKIAVVLFHLFSGLKDT